MLAGGGAKGLAHVGVIQVLDSAGIKPGLVVGTSIGAIVGALYASGYTGHEIDSLVRTLDLSDLVGTRPVQIPLTEDPLYPLVRWETGPRGLHLQPLATSDAYLDGLLNGILVRGNLEARGNFDSLPIPFRAVATDFSSRQAVVLASGDLAQSVRASYAIPVVFSPVRLNGRVLVDGGLAADVPVAIARNLGAVHVIVVTLSEPSMDSVDAASPIAVVGRMVDFLFAQPPDSLLPGDVSIVAPVSGVGSLDFSRATTDSAIAAGARAARHALQVDRCLAAREKPGHVARSLGPPLYFAGMTVNGGRPNSGDLARELGLKKGAPIQEKLLSQRLTQLPRITNYADVWLWPHQTNASGPDSGRPTDSASVGAAATRAPAATGAPAKRGADAISERRDSVRFDAVVQRVATFRGGLGIAYDNDLGGRLWLGALMVPFSSGPFTIGGTIRLGQLEQGALVLARGYGGGVDAVVRPSSIIDFSNENIQLFSPTDHLVGTTRTQDLVFATGVAPTLATGLGSALGLEARGWADSSAGWQSTVGGFVRITGGSGKGDPWLRAEAAWTTAYQRLSLDATGVSTIGALRITPRLEYNWGQHLPLELTTPLGGSDGFAGLPIGDRRGDRVIVGLVGLTYPIIGPINARVEAMGGASTTGGPPVPETGWLGGVRAGLGADTPVGPVRAEYGTSGDGRRAVFVRIGHWF